MPRQLRNLSGTGIYHVVSRGNNKENIFKEEADKKLYLRLLKKTLKKHPVKIYAYCIMIDHIHIMLKAEFEHLSGFMQYANSVYAQIYNTTCGRCGHVFQGRFFSDCVETDEYFWCCMRYIHNNPVKINLVKQPYNYPFSSAAEIYADKHYLVNKDSYSLISTKFPDKEDFWLYHRLFENKPFIDTPEDKERHDCERVRNSLTRFMFDHGIENIQTLMRIREFYNGFCDQCVKETGLASLRIQNILKVI